MRHGPRADDGRYGASVHDIPAWTWPERDIQPEDPPLAPAHKGRPSGADVVAEA
eukprot:gene13143-3889_t